MAYKLLVSKADREEYPFIYALGLYFGSLHSYIRDEIATARADNAPKTVYRRKMHRGHNEGWLDIYDESKDAIRGQLIDILRHLEIPIPEKAKKEA